MRMHQVFKNLGRSRNRKQTLVQEQARVGRKAGIAGGSGIGGWNTMESLESRTYMTIIGTPDFYQTFENIPLNVDGTIVSGVLANDTTGTTLPQRAVIGAQPTHGKVTLAQNGSFVYTPTPNYHGPDSFTYTAQSNPAPATTLIPLSTHPWRWLHPTNGQNPSTLDPDFHTTWYLSEGNPLVPVFPGTGMGRFGYGAFDDAIAINTPIGVNGTTTAPADGSRFTAYFRTTFDFPTNPSSLSSMVMTGLFDDGAIFYLNGQVLGTYNMPSATDTYTGFATNAPAEARGTIDLFAQIPNLASRLVQGTNTLAMSLHNAAANSSDLGFDMTVTAGFASEQSAPTTVSIDVQNSFSPPIGTPDSYVVAEGGTLQVQTAANLLVNDGDLTLDQGFLFDILPPANLPAGAIFTPDVASATFNLNLTGAPNFFGPITFTYILQDIHGQSSPVPVTVFVTNVNDAPVAIDDPAPGQAYQMNQGTVFTSGVNSADTSIFPMGSTWGYDDSNTDLHVRNPNWNDLSFDIFNPGNGSPAWKTGAAPLGFPGGTTILSFGPDANNKYPAYYFRKNFNLADATAFNAGRFNLFYDDGAVIYINGIEVYRENMPAGTIGHTTPPPAAGNATVLRSFAIPAGVLVDGDNVIAVEVHQVNGTSSDIAFNMALSLFKTSGVLLNDVDADSAGITAQVATQPAHGTLIFDTFGNFTYTPQANYFGPDSFTYTITDAAGEVSAPATVSFNILEADVPPTPTNDLYSFPEGGTLDTVALGVSLLSNDFLERPITGLAVIQQPSGGAVFLTPPGLDGHFVLTHPNPDFSGQVTFTYQLTDTVGTGPIGTVTIDITPVNDLPIANDDPSIPGAFTTTQGAPYSSSSFFNLLPLGSSWRELNIQTGIDPAVADPDFNTTWYTSTGVYNGPAFSAPIPAPIHVGTVDGLLGGTVTALPPSGSRYTSYYTTTFNFTGNPVEIVRMTANILVDDGMVLYLNGVEVGRHNFAAGLADTFTAFAAGTISESAFIDVNLTNFAAALANGLNTLAVSVHQANNTSSDFGFDLGLKAYGASGAGVLANDTDLETGTGSLVAILNASPLYGTLTLQTDGQFFYTPSPNFIGADTFTYFANDGANNSAAPAIVSIIVTDGNLPPVLVDDASLYFTNEDQVLDTLGDGGFDNVYRNDGLMDLDGVAFDPILEVIVDDSSTNGTVVFDVATGHFVFTPDPDFTGPTTFTYQVRDKDGFSNPAVVTITVNAVNDLPIANDDFYQVIENGSVGETAGAQIFPRFSTWFFEDSNVDLHTLAPTWNQPGFNPLAPTDGPIWQTGVGKFGFGDPATTPLRDFDQPTFYLRKDFTLTGAQASNFDILRLNVLRDDGVVIYINGIEVMRSNMPTGAVTYATLASVAIDAANETTYFPFVIDLTDLNLFPGGNPLEAGQNVIAVELHQASLTSSDIGFDMDMALFAAGVGLLANDADPEGAILTASIFTQPQFGSVTMTADGSFLYTPFGNYSGPDSFTYRASDGANFSLPATVHITVINDPFATPVSVNDGYAMVEDTTLTVSDPAFGVLANEYGIPAGLTIVYDELTDGPANGTLTLNLTDGTFTYVPNENFWGTETFTYRVTDGVLTSAPATVTITITNQPDPPIAIPDAYPQYTAEEGGVPLDTAAIFAPGLLDNDLSPDGVAITASLLSANPGGTVVVNTDGSFVFTPGPNFYGPYHFEYLARSAAIRLIERGGTAAAPVGDQLWSYLDNGTNPGASWNTLAFDDSAWPTGVGELGYGDGDERTVVSFIDADPTTPGTVEKNATTFFRTKFNVLDSSAITQLVLNTTWDDGIAIYINGIEVFRDFLAPNAAFNEFSTGGPAVEGVFVTTNITVTPGMLVDGDNVVAVEVHQVNNTSSDVSFDLELDALFATHAQVTIDVTPTAPRAPVGVFDIFNGEEDVPLVGNVLLNEFGPNLTANLFSSMPAEYGDLVLNPDGSFVFTPAPNFNTTQLPPEQFPGDPNAYLLFFYTVTRDYGGGLLLTGDPIFVQLNISPTPDAPVGLPDSYTVVDGETYTANVSSATIDLIARGGTAANPLGNQSWQYLDDGSDLGVFWTSNTFDDSFWFTGISQLGYGDGDERTVVNSVDVDLETPGLQRNATTYFRTHFFLDDPTSITSLLLSVYADDGVAVYLNGREIFRNNLVADAAFDTYAIAGIGTEDIFLDSVIAVTPGLLRFGDNVIAVEVHQDTAASSDISMDLELRAVVVTENSGVLANDHDPDFDAVTATLVTPPQFHDNQGGTAPFILNPNGSFNYRRMAGVYGDDTFTYTVSDGVNTSNPITVTLSAPPPGLPRDVNGDGFYTTADIDALGRYLFQGGPLPLGQADLTGGSVFDSFTGVPDGVIDSNDRDFLVTYVLGTFYGDANYDIEGGIGDFVSISIGDLVILASNFNKPGNWGWADGDFNSDNTITIGDLVLLAANFNSTAPVPNPPFGNGLLVGEGDGALVGQNDGGVDALGMMADGDGSWDHIDEALNGKKKSPSHIIDVLAEM